jgi:hypothetical protein
VTQLGEAAAPDHADSQVHGLVFVGMRRGTTPPH